MPLQLINSPMESFKPYIDTLNLYVTSFDSIISTQGFSRSAFSVNGIHICAKVLNDVNKHIEAKTINRFILFIF